MPLPGRPRRRFLTKGSAALMALLVGGVGFLAACGSSSSVSRTSSSAARTLGSSAAPGGSVNPGGGLRVSATVKACLRKHAITLPGGWHRNEPLAGSPPSTGA